HIELPGNKRQVRSRRLLDDRVFDPVEIRPVFLPVIRVAGDFNAVIGLELDELERAGADRMLAHLRRRAMTGIDRREPAGKQHRESGLWPLQFEGDLVITVRRYVD